MFRAKELLNLTLNHKVQGLPRVVLTTGLYSPLDIPKTSTHVGSGKCWKYIGTRIETDEYSMRHRIESHEYSVPLRFEFFLSQPKDSHHAKT